MTNNMFDSIKAALETNSSAGQAAGLYQEVLKTPPGKTYIVKILPFAADPSKTFHHYYMHGWTSFATGQYVGCLSPTTYGERDPISEARFKALRDKGSELAEKFNKVRRAEKWYVNVLVLDDPNDPDNNGKVKILRYGKQLGKIIEDAISGEDSDEFGARVFDMSKNGVNLKIKVDEQGGYANYTSSRFASVNPVNYSDVEAAEIYEKCHPLDEVNTARTYDEIIELMNEHIYVDDVTNTEPDTTTAAITDAISAATSVPADDASKNKPVATEVNSDIDDLLDGLDL